LPPVQEPGLVAALIDAAKGVIDQHADELTRLDQAVGDGDYGASMRRGFGAIAAQRDALAAMEPGEALQKAGMTLVSTVGGASGPLTGSLLVAMGKAVKAGSSWVDAFGEGVEAMKRRGKSDVGEKTMLDVLVPVLEALRSGVDLAAVREVAAASRAATRDMVATRGRASFLGERSRGHDDPGAAGAQLVIGAVCDVLERGRGA
jgi:phosphoenolpyruvate---glycerone phosphotransferase subunit DhaL